MIFFDNSLATSCEYCAMNDIVHFHTRLYNMSGVVGLETACFQSRS
jgi:hypothetical protein